MLTEEAVIVTRQVKLSTLVQAAYRYDLPFVISRKLQTHGHTQIKPINIIHVHVGVDSKSSCCNSPGEALHVGASSVSLRPPIPDISEITNAHTHTHGV